MYFISYHKLYFISYHCILYNIIEDLLYYGVMVQKSKRTHYANCHYEQIYTFTDSHKESLRIQLKYTREYDLQSLWEYNLIT